MKIKLRRCFSADQLNKLIDFLLEKAVLSRRELFDPEHESAFRLFSGFTEGYRDLVVDIYGKTLVIHDYANEPDQELIDEITNYFQQTLVWLRAGVVKTRNGETQLEKQGQIVFGNKVDEKIKEHGVWWMIVVMLLLTRYNSPERR